MNIQGLQSQVSPHFMISDVSLKVEPGQILTLIGRSGSGKSTLLRSLAGLHSYSADINQIDRPIGMVFQSSNLFPHLTLIENVKLALIKVMKKSNKEATQIAEDVLCKVKLAHRKTNYPHQLSGGEQQRGAIARALALQPRTIIYDEPTSALDPELVDEVFDIMLDLKKTGIIQVAVTHEMRAVKKISDLVALMDGGKLQFVCHYSDLSKKASELQEANRKYVELFI